MFKKRKGNLYLIILIIFLFFFIIFNITKINNFFFIINKKITLPIVSFISSLKAIKNTYLNSKIIKDIQNELYLLKIENQILKSENEKLQKILNIKENKNIKKIKTIANVIGANNEGFIFYYLIDKGKNDGVEEGDGVIYDGFVLGRVVNVFETSSKVQLLIDEKSSISIRNERSKVIGILSGKGYNECVINFVPKEEDMKEGDIIVTSNLSKSFPEGIKVGIITEVNKKTDSLSMNIKVKPFVDIYKADIVIILQK